MLRRSFDLLASRLGVLRRSFDLLASRLGVLRRSFDLLASRLGVLRRSFDLLASRVGMLQRSFDLLASSVRALERSIGLHEREIERLRRSPTSSPRAGSPSAAMISPALAPRAPSLYRHARFTMACAHEDDVRPSPVTTTARFRIAASGRIDTLQHGRRVGGEEFTDDGDTLTSRISMGSQSATLELKRSARSVTIHAGGTTVRRQIPSGAIALENGSWQAYVVAAEQHADATTSRSVTVWVPGQDASVDGTIQVEAKPAGDRLVTLDAQGVRVVVMIGADGVVSSGRVYGQDVEARVATGEADEAPAPAWPPSGLHEESVEVRRDGAALRGVIDMPANGHGTPIVIVVAGSGPTDRDGNGAGGLYTNTYRQLAVALAARGIATLRYDKRGIGASERVPESTITLDTLTEDARAFVAHLRSDGRFGPVSVAGHSEGGIVALRLARTTEVDGLALLATPGRPLATVLHEQLARKLPAPMLADADRLMAAVLSGSELSNVPKGLDVLFRSSVVPFLRSMLDVDPAKLVAAARAHRIAIVQGENDRQVSPEDARLLAAAREGAELVLLPGVSHTLKTDAATSDPQPSYFDPSFPLAPGVVEAVARVAATGPRT